MSEIDKKPAAEPSKKQNFVLTSEPPRFATRILANASADAVVFSFGLENPANASEVHMHTRIAMSISAIKSFAKMLERMTTDLELKKAMQGVQYSHIASDS
ncbi:hypothetical protein AUK40_01120 [Candidatus Wirthbacteria bacterium CG2_30_54_11]|uniref:DUF3467 domain-containing protein n=1 Tax=Candidatus Wirthbacteria bacterium CG2_30_54_11 TaxID=1817892 RepID=A0A1J5J064_9BACT|nr:MAG: hypothetical protein AUK40_01120 [Candidatus Wirthbacteria bacterium CG2_30_54_11]